MYTCMDADTQTHARTRKCALGVFALGHHKIFIAGRSEQENQGSLPEGARSKGTCVLIAVAMQLVACLRSTFFFNIAPPVTLLLRSPPFSQYKRRGASLVHYVKTRGLARFPPRSSRHQSSGTQRTRTSSTMPSLAAVSTAAFLPLVCPFRSFRPCTHCCAQTSCKNNDIAAYVGVMPSDMTHASPFRLTRMK